MFDENDNPGSGRRIYRAGDTEDEDPRASRNQARSRRRSTPILAVAVLIAVAVVIMLAGVASRDGGLQGSQSETGTFKLLPITTTTTS